MTPPQPLLRFTVVLLDDDPLNHLTLLALLVAGRLFLKDTEPRTDGSGVVALHCLTTSDEVDLLLPPADRGGWVYLLDVDLEHHWLGGWKLYSKIEERDEAGMLFPVMVTAKLEEMAKLMGKTAPTARIAVYTAADNQVWVWVDGFLRQRQTAVMRKLTSDQRQAAGAALASLSTRSATALAGLHAARVPDGEEEWSLATLFPVHANRLSAGEDPQQVLADLRQTAFEHGRLLPVVRRVYRLVTRSEPQNVVHLASRVDIGDSSAGPKWDAIQPGLRAGLDALARQWERAEDGLDPELKSGLVADLLVTRARAVLDARTDRRRLATAVAELVRHAESLPERWVSARLEPRAFVADYLPVPQVFDWLEAMLVAQWARHGWQPRGWRRWVPGWGRSRGAPQPDGTHWVVVGGRLVGMYQTQRAGEGEWLDLAAVRDGVTAVVRCESLSAAAALVCGQLGGTLTLLQGRTVRRGDGVGRTYAVRISGRSDGDVREERYMSPEKLRELVGPVGVGDHPMRWDSTGPPVLAGTWYVVEWPACRED